MFKKLAEKLKKIFSSKEVRRTIKSIPNKQIQTSIDTIRIEVLQETEKVSSVLDSYIQNFQNQVDTEVKKVKKTKPSPKPAAKKAAPKKKQLDNGFR